MVSWNLLCDDVADAFLLLTSRTGAIDPLIDDTFGAGGRGASHVIQLNLTTHNSNTGMEGTQFHTFAKKNAHVHSQTKFAELLLLGLADTEWDF